MSHLWHPYTPDPPIGPKTVWKSASGSYLYDQTGKSYLDAISSWWCQLHGHCHPKLVEAATEQLSQMDQVLFAPHSHEVGTRLADLLVKKAGAPFSRVFFSDDGSTAVEAALKMSVQYWQNVGQPNRQRFLSLVEGYHGDTLGAISVGYVKEFHHYFKKTIQPSFQATQPYCYRCPLEKSYPSCDLACLQSPKEIVDKYADQIAAVIVEPIVMGAAGMVIYPESYLQGLVRLCRDRGIHVIFDEVFTGFGRTGSLFAFEHIDERPDFLCLSKGLTSGVLPLGVTLTHEKIYEAFCGEERKKLYHGHTFTANPVGCAVALKSLELFDEENTLGKVKQLSMQLEGEKKRFALLPHVGDVRQKGAIWAVELVKDKHSKAEPSPANGPGWRICEKLFEKGVFIRPMHNVLYLVPPYCMSESELQLCLDLMYEEISNEDNF